MSMCDGPPSMKNKMHDLALAGSVDVSDFAAARCWGRDSAPSADYS